jgi:hypothetical protein
LGYRIGCAVEQAASNSNPPMMDNTLCFMASPIPDSSVTGETGGKSATGRDRTHTSRESRLSRTTPPFRDEPS